MKNVQELLGSLRMRDSDHGIIEINYSAATQGIIVQSENVWKMYKSYCAVCECETQIMEWLK